MKRLQNKITYMLADAALLEMGVDIQIAAELHTRIVSEPSAGALTRFFQIVTDTLADAALLEMGVTLIVNAGTMYEALSERVIVHPDECQYGDNDICFRRAA